MGTRPAAIIGFSIVLAAAIAAFGLRPLTSAAGPTTGSLTPPEVEYENGSVEFLTGRGASTASNTIMGRMKITHSGDFLIVKHWGDAGVEYGLYIPKERVIYAGGVQNRK